MKKTLTAAALILAAACSKAPGVQDVRLSPSLVETGAMTRSADHAEILGLIESAYTPFAVELYTDEASNQFMRMEFGRTYTVPVGTWRVTGQNSITPTGAPNDIYTLAKSPSFYTDTYVTIRYGTYEYAVPVAVYSAGVVYDRSEVGQIQYQGNGGSFVTLQSGDLVLSDNYGLFFVNGIFSGDARVYVKVVPKTGAQKETTFMLSAREQASGSAVFCLLEGGKYYVLHPDAITELCGVSFSISIPAWECAID